MFDVPKKKQTRGVTAEIRITRCYGCGAILQSDKPYQPGYIKKEKLESQDSDLLCERCYRLRHYGEVKESAPAFNTDYITILEQANQNGSLVVYVLDSVFIESGFIDDLFPYLKNCLVVLNKKDILPTDFPEQKLISKVRERLEAANVHPLDILMISTQKNINMDELMKEINEYRKGNDVFFVGVNNVGKSTIVNKILKNYKNNTSKMITTSKYPGTTLGVISIPLDEDSYMFDTPGIYNESSLTNQVEKSCLKYILPREQIKTRSYQLDEGRSLIFGGIVRFDFVEKQEDDKKKSGFSVFVSNDVDITNTKLDKNKADNTFKSIVLENKLKPVSESIKDIKDLKRHEFVLPLTAGENENSKITVVGFCTIYVKPKGQKIALWVPKNVKVLVDLTNYRS